VPVGFISKIFQKRLKKKASSAIIRAGERCQDDNYRPSGWSSNQNVFEE
jgi:hypothetical protein